MPLSVATIRKTKLADHCTGDVSYSYNLPISVDYRVVEKLSSLGKVQQVVTAKRKIWLIESIKDFVLTLREGFTLMEVRYKKQNITRSLHRIESLLKDIFNVDIELDYS